MVISDKQHEANRQNAQHSTGPITPEGKAAVRLNALKYGLRAQDMLIPGEDPEGYTHLWEELVADWQPADRTERLHLEQMAITQWLLSRVACAEHHAYADPLSFDAHFNRLMLIAKYKTTLERSFDKALNNLRQSKKDSRVHANPQPQPAQPKPAAKPAPAPNPPPASSYVMSDQGSAIHEVYCAPTTNDSR